MYWERKHKKKNSSRISNSWGKIVEDEDDDDEVNICSSNIATSTIFMNQTTTEAQAHNIERKKRVKVIIKKSSEMNLK